MMKEYLSFDIEIYNDLPENNKYKYYDIVPSVGALCQNIENVDYYWDKPHMTKETAQKLVLDIQKIVSEGKTLFGWNILSFDLPILAHYSSMIEEVGRIALDCCDPMFIVVCEKGHYLGLDSALIGHNIETKLHVVKLKDGTKISDMDGSKCPLLFRSGEYDAVLEYLSYDVWQPYKLAFSIEKTGGIKWTSKSGRNNFLRTSLKSVRECISIKNPDVSWMKNPPLRESFYSWIPEKILKEEGVI